MTAVRKPGKPKPPRGQKSKAAATNAPRFVGKHGAFVAGAKLGSGGMADVFRGKANDSSIEVAIKVPKQDIDATAKSMFLGEAAAAAMAAGPGVVRVLDWGDSPSFIAFEYVEHPTLDKEIARRHSAREPWSIAELVEIFRKLVAAMSAINKHVLHRDLKPANMFYGPGADIRVADFGLAKFVSEATRSNTFKGWGTLAYMSPEAWANVSLNWRSDQYAMGVVFFELASLRRPFDGTLDELKRKHLFERPLRLESIVPQFPLRLSSVIARMLEKRPEDRYQSWQEVETALSSAAQALAVSGGRDPLAQKVVKVVERSEQERLQQQEKDLEFRRESTNRGDIIKYWWDGLSQRAISRIDAINHEAAREAIKYTTQSNSLTARFHGTTLSLSIEPVPPTESEVLGWGFIKVAPDTPPQRGEAKKLCVANFVLLRDPLPYGQWFEVSMEVNPIMRDISASDLYENGGGRFEILGQNRMVLALNWPGLLSQRVKRRAMSLVQYREVPLDFDATLQQCLEVLVENAAK